MEKPESLKVRMLQKGCALTFIDGAVKEQMENYESGNVFFVKIEERGKLFKKYVQGV